MGSLKTTSKVRSLSRRILTTFVLFLSLNGVAQQLPECGSNVPFFILDLTNSPDSVYTTPEIVRQDQCCGGAGNENYVSFYVTLHPDVAMVEIGIAPGYADPSGSGFYNIVSGGDLITPGTCGPDIPGGTTACITGAGPHKITYHKPGSNKVKYYLKQVPRPIFPQNDTTRVGCILPMEIYGLDNITITSINSSTGNTTPGAYNSLLSCTNCSTPEFEPGLATPAWIDYQICGSPIASACGVFQNCDTVRLYTMSQLSGNITPNPASFCIGGSVNLTASASGGDADFSYNWYASNMSLLGTGTTYSANTAGTFTVEIMDGLVSPTCPAKFISVPVTEGQLPVVDAGADQTVCATSPIVFLAGSVSNATGGTWSGGAGYYSPGVNDLLITYTPTSAEISSGSVTLTLTSTGAGGGCANQSDDVTIFFSDTVNVNVTMPDILCNGGTTNLSANVTGGTAPYIYNWTTGSTASNIVASSGTYSITVYDSYGCPATTSATIPEPNQLNLSFSSTTTSTDVACDGDATVTIGGGTAPYSVVWDDPLNQTTLTATGLCYGAHQVTVTDANGCIVQSSVVVNNPSCSGFDVSASNIDVSCYGDSDARAFSFPSGGTAPYTYSWNTSPVQTTQNSSGLSAGTYTVTVTDFNGCVQMASVTVTQPTTITNTMPHTDATSIGGTDGTATANPLGGTPGYTYTWVPGSQTNQTATNLSAGVYYVTIEDSKACNKLDSVQINQPPCNNFMLGVNTSDISCFGANDGSAYIVIAQGTPPYSITWSSGETNVTSVSGLSSGNYTVTVTDASNCTTFESFNITEPTELSIGLVATNITCYGANDGTIDLTVSGGTFPYTFEWLLGTRPIATSEDIIDLPPGTYSVTVTDANGCSVSGSIGVTQPTKITGTSVSTDITCNGNADGTIDATITGGTAPYTYLWTGPGGYTASVQDLTSLNYGLYELQVTDINGCHLSPLIQAFINEPDVVEIVTYTVPCPIPGTTSVVVTVDSIQGGNSSDYQVSFDGGSTYQALGNYSATLSINNSYNIMAMDQDGCTTPLPTSILIDPAVTINNVTFDPCVAPATTDIPVTVTVLGGDSGPYQISSDNGSTFNTAGVYTINLPVGNSYNIVAEDGKTCMSVAWPIVIPSPFDGSAIMTAEETCAGAYDGSIDLTVSGGTTPYGFSWTGPFGFTAATEDLSGLTAGTYDVTVTDNNGCTQNHSVNLTTTPDVTPPVITYCPTNTTVNSQSGVCTYTVSGTGYDVTATDNCVVASMLANLTGATTATGLTTLDGVTFNLGTTTVTWTVTDGSGNTDQCIFDVVVEDNELPVFTACVGSTQTVNSDPGVCTYTVSGSAWDATATDNCTVSSVLAVLTGATTATGLTTLDGVTFNLGTTTVTWTITDGSGNTDQCIFDVVVEDNELPVFTACVGSTQTVNSDPGVCTHTVSGSAWDATATDNCTVSSVLADLTGATTATGLTTLDGVTFNLGTTTITWTVTDGSGNTDQCIFDVVVEDNELPVFTACVGSTQTVNSDPGVCTYMVSGSAWDATATDNCTVSSVLADLTGATTATGLSTLDGVIFNLGTTTVTWTVTDGSGNTDQCIFDVVVEDNELPVISNCPSDITVSTDAGVCNADVTWTIPSFTDNCGATMVATHTPGDNFPVGTTTVTYTVTDGSGNVSVCTFDIIVNDTELPTISCASNIASCDPYITYASPTVNDNCGVNSVTQTSGLPSGSNFPVGTTTNTFEVVDIHGNVSTCSFDVTIHPLPIISLSATDISCFGFGDGAIDATITSGTSPFNYSWSNGATSEDLTNLQSGTYTLTVTDANGCTDNDAATINEPAQLALVKEVDNVLCYGGSDGAIDITVTGGIAPYNYNWTNSATTEDLSGLTIGTYVVEVTDQNGCLLTNSTTIVQPNEIVILGSVVDATCTADNGSVSVLVTGGVSPYTYLWSNGATTANLSNVPSGSYTLTLTDANGCMATYTDTVNSVSNLQASVVTTDALCYGDENGTAVVIVESGTQPFSYTWSTGSHESSVTNLAAGNYTVDVTDYFGCSVILNFTINQPDELILNLTPSTYSNGYNISEYGSEDGYITSSVSGGTAPYSYVWSTDPEQYSEDVYNLGTGNYILIVEDANGCITTGGVRLTGPIELAMPEGISPNGDYDNDYFVVKGIEAYPDNYITIYNRWGNIVYETSAYHNEWEGQNNQNEPLPDGTYYVVLEVNGSSGKTTLTGYVDLRRSR